MAAPAIAGALAIPILGFILGLTVIGGATGTEPPPPVAADIAAGSICATSGPLAGLTDEQAANARVITATASQTGGSQAASIAVMTAITESGLRVLNYGDAVGPDSRGLFQQRDSWGTLAQRLDPVASTGLFMARLTSLVAWQTMEPWAAAQRVQISAFDGNPRAANNYNSIFGGNYQPHYEQAKGIVAAVAADGAACDTITIPPGYAFNHGLPALYTIPATATPTQTKVVAYAIAQLDKPYVFGTSGPNSFDCSGLTSAAWRQVGVNFQAWTIAQATTGTATTYEAIQPGDLVLVAGDGGTIAAPDHVGMYIGRDLVISATAPATGIRVVPYADFLLYGHGLSTIRHIQ